MARVPNHLTFKKPSLASAVCIKFFKKLQKHENFESGPISFLSSHDNTRHFTIHRASRKQFSTLAKEKLTPNKITNHMQVFVGCHKMLCLEFPSMVLRL